MISTIDIYEISGLHVIFNTLISQGSSRKKSFFIMEILKKIIIGIEGNIALRHCVAIIIKTLAYYFSLKFLIVVKVNDTENLE